MPQTAPSTTDDAPPPAGEPYEGIPAPGGASGGSSPAEQRLRRLSGAFIGLQVLLRAMVVGAGFFYWDDYVFQGRAARLPLFSSEYLLYSHDGHVMPGAFLLTGILERVGPLNYWPTLATTLLMQWAATYLTYRLLVAIFGLRPGVVALVGLLALTPLTLPAATWWASAVNLLPMQMATAAAGLAVIRLYHEGGARWVVIGLVALVTALAFYEKAVLMLVAVFAAVMVLGPKREGLRHALGRVWWRTRAFWIPAAPLVVAYLAWFRGVSDAGFKSLEDTSSVVVLAAETIGRGVIPALPGGPLAWLPVGGGAAFADPPAWLVGLSLWALVATVAFGCWLTRRARWVWSIAGLYLGLDVLAMVLGRSGVGSFTALGLSLRYTADAVVVLTIAIGASFMAPAGRPAPSRWIRLRARILERPGWLRTLRWSAAAAALVAMTMAFVSSVTLIGPLTANPSRLWLNNVKQSTEGLETIPVLLDGPVPADVYTPLGAPYNQLSWVLAPLDHRIRFGGFSYRDEMLDGAGRLVPAGVVGAETLPGPIEDCGWEASTTAAVMRLNSVVPRGRHVVRLGFLAKAPTDVELQFGTGNEISVPVFPGLGEVYANIEGEGNVLRVGPTDAGVSVCIGDAQVGALIPR